METQDQTTIPENANVNPERTRALEDAYGQGDEGAAEGQYAQNVVQRINDALQAREGHTLVFNGLPYSRSYLYNRQKAINYAPPRNPKDDREVSFGIIHEKIIAFVALFIKYRFKRRIKCYDADGKLIEGLGDFYDLAIEFSQREEKLIKKIALIYWEMFVQGDAFIYEDWEVKTLRIPDAYKVGKDGEPEKVTVDSMDYSFEFVEGLTYKEGKPFQTRRAVSRLLDGRSVILANPEIEELQDQPQIYLEDEIDRSEGEALYGTLKRWDAVPADRSSINRVTPDKTELFNTQRLAHPEKRLMRHFVFDKANNRFNLYLNGIMMLPRETTMTLFYPRNNFPLSKMPAERMTGSAYSRSVPAKTKFNADYLDWILKNLALKFEQGILPAILAKGKYTLSRDIFRAGQVTHGVSKDDFEFADPNNKGLQGGDFSFANMIKEIVQNQTTAVLSAGDLSTNPTAEEVASLEQNQREKLAFILDGLMNGFMDMALRRAETIESKYTLKQKETVVDGKTLSVYQNFNISVGGVNHSVILDDSIGTQDYGHDDKRYELFQESFKSKKDGKPSEFYLVDPITVRRGGYVIDMEIVPEKVKETDLAVQLLYQDIATHMKVFGQQVTNLDEWKKIYLEVSGRPSSVFTSQSIMELQRLEQERAAMAGAQPAAPDSGTVPPASPAAAGPAPVAQ